MQYNWHIEKYKQADIGGIRKEQFREYKNDEQYRNNVQPELSKENLYVGMHSDGTGCDWQAEIKAAKESMSKITGRAVRKDAVVLCSAVESVPRSWDNNTCRRYFMDKAKWFRDYLCTVGHVDNDALLSLVVHLDETTPHATYAWMPIKEGRLQAKNVITKSFLQQLQQDGQDFTLAWIEVWNAFNPDNQIEKLEPYVHESMKKHLTEIQFKEEMIRQRQELVQQQEKEIVHITAAPSLPEYKHLMTENKALAAELTDKSRLVDQLQTEAQQLKGSVSDLTRELDDITEKIGSRILKSIGYDVKPTESIPEYPDSRVLQSIVSMRQDVEISNPRNYRILPDLDSPGMYRVAENRDGVYQTIKGGFSSRALASAWQKNAVTASISLSLKVKQEIEELQKQQIKN
ncbi:MAG: plasmid recombination protein [Eubacterium sp.]|nr:plasmid recombination protein [Eubacterium sp.]